MKSLYRRMLTQKFERHTHRFLDYQQATNNEIPDRWWQTIRSLAKRQAAINF